MFDLWNSDRYLPSVDWGKYVAISGNTGAGKSTLVNTIVTKAQILPLTIIGIDERELHHPYLKLMFSHPTQFAFPVQLNFLLQRHLVLRRWLGSGYIVVVERSHLDDEMFVQHHFDAGHISNEEYKTYLLLADVLHRELPLPDVFVCLDVKPEISMQRITKSEVDGERPREFPSEEIKWRYINSWYKRYHAFHEQVSKEIDEYSGSQKEIIYASAELTPETLAEKVLYTLLKMLKET